MTTKLSLIDDAVTRYFYLQHLPISKRLNK